MKQNPKKILIITSEFPPQPGGIGNHAYNLASNLANNDFEVEVMADQRDSGNEERSFDEQLNFKVHRIKLRAWRFIMYINRVKIAFSKIKTADIVIASGKFSLWLVSFISFFYKRYCVAVIHGSEVNFKKFGLKTSINYALKQFNKVIAVSNYTKSLVSELNLRSIAVIPNGFDASDWKETTDENIELYGNPNLITVGNVTKRKGQLNVIQHLPHVLKYYPEVHYHCVGLPTEKENFTKIAEKLKVNDHVTFHGRIKHDELKQFLNTSDIFVMLSSPTSSGDVEGFGIAILEANYLGIPAIGSLGCGIEDAIDYGSSGILIDHSDKDQFKDAIDAILDKREGFSINARAWAEKHTWDKVIKLYIKEIQSL